MVSSEVEDEVELPEHNQSMRRAARYCLDLLSSLPLSLFLDSSIDDSLRAHRRQEAYENFWRVSPTATESVFPQIRYSELSSPVDFRRQFHDLNLPCLIDFDSSKCDQRWFSIVDRQWRLQRTDDNQRNAVNRDWFIDNLGADASLPVRFQPPNTVELDNEGRATECETQQTSVVEWIQMLKVSGKDDMGRSPHYLKDWHLLLGLQDHQDCSLRLYECPPIFEHDILNSFLCRFTKGDYRFCYWGPRGSYTTRHSDVLHSFSWSYNVVGTKQWIFFQDLGSPTEESNIVHPPKKRLNHKDQIVVIQKAGQAMFVPSKWQHEVVNLEETISINHNWVTTANLDQCWECLVAEMVDIKKELSEWEINDNLEAEESMLRGCVGLDVTAFFLMTLVRLCDLLSPPEIEKQEESCSDGTIVLERELDIARLVRQIRRVRCDGTVQLKGRLEHVLQSNNFTTNLLSAVDKLIEHIDES